MNFLTIKYLPWSGRRYKVNSLGKILDGNDNVLVPTLISEEPCVEIDWVQGKRFYKVAVLVLYAFELVSLPDYLIDKILPLYIDKDKSNCYPVNLLYKFRDGPLEHEFFKGFFYIPFYSDYAISKTGELINIKTGKFKSWSITKASDNSNSKDGYRYSRVINNLGFSKCLFQHRAICFVFKDYDEAVFSLVVNHIDGEPSNNEIDNLEFVTYTRNNIHAVETGLRTKGLRAITVLNTKTNEEINFKSIEDCVKHFGFASSSIVKYRLKHCKDKIFEDGLLIKYSDNEKWQDVEELKFTRYCSDFIARNVFTGETVIFSGSYAGSEIIGVKRETIIKHAKESLIIPINGWNIRYHKDGEEILWPQHPKRNLQVYEKYPIYPPNGVICFDHELNEETFFLSATEAYGKFHLSKCLFYKLVNNKEKLANRYSFEIYNIKNNLSLPMQ